MAKLNYSKPLFDIRPIPLETTAGGSGGCALKSNLQPGFCAVQTEFERVFVEANTDCQSYSQGDEAVFCYTVPDNDYNVYNS